VSSVRAREFGLWGQRRPKTAIPQNATFRNGTVLVMMEMHHNGEVVIKTRLVPAGDGKTLSLEMTRVLPAGSTATYTFTERQ